LAPGEQIIISEPARYGNKAGVLTLTNKRVVFESQSGIVSKKTYTNVDFALTSVTGATVEGLASKKLLVSLQRGNYPPRYEFSVGDPVKWRGALTAACSSASSTATQSETITKEKEVIIKEVVKVKCRYCGALVDITESKCSGCGAPLR
jgi:hypothetical protein